MTIKKLIAELQKIAKEHGDGTKVFTDIDGRRVDGTLHMVVMDINGKNPELVF